MVTIFFVDVLVPLMRIPREDAHVMWNLGDTSPSRPSKMADFTVLEELAHHVEHNDASQKGPSILNQGFQKRHDEPG